MHAVDAKNRLAIPAEHRAVIERKSEERTVYIAPHPRGADCLIGYDSARLAELRENIRARYGLVESDERDAETARAVGLTTSHNYDDAGRIMFGADLKADSGIVRWVVFFGMADHFEIWDPVAMRKAKQGDPVILRRLDREMAARGLA